MSAPIVEINDGQITNPVTDPVTGNVTTTTKIETDINADGDVDVIQTNTVVTDPVGNTVDTNIVVDGEDVDVNLDHELNLVPSSEDALALLQEIASLQAQVSCEKLQHLGSMEDYASLFRKAKEYIDNYTENGGSINLVVDTSVLDRFAAEASVYSQMFEEVTMTFTRIKQVDELETLNKIKDGLLKITEMYRNIDRFHAAINATSVLQIPESIRDASSHLDTVLSSIECSLPYLEWFADKNTTTLTADQLSRATLDVEDRAALDAAMGALEAWNAMIVNEGNVTMSGNQYVQAFKAKIASFDPLYDRLHAVVGKVRTRLNAWKLGEYA